MKPRLVIFGTSPFGLASFSALADSSLVDIVGVVTQPARPVGRHRELQPTPVDHWAKDRGYDIATPTTLKDDRVVAWLTARQPDCFLVASYGLIIPPTVLAIPPRSSINLPASLLPRHRGATPIAAAIAAGDAVTGVTFMVMDTGVDTGGTLRQFALPIATNDTRPILEERLSLLASAHIVQTMKDWFEGHLTAKPQPDTGITTCRRLTREDGRAVWGDAHALERSIRANTPWPGLWTTWQGREIKILTASQVGPSTPGATPGTVVLGQHGWGIACSHGTLYPTTVQFEGRRPLDAKLVPGSYPGFVGAVLG